MGIETWAPWSWFKGKRGPVSASTTPVAWDPAGPVDPAGTLAFAQYAPFADIQREIDALVERMQPARCRVVPPSFANTHPGVRCDDSMSLGLTPRRKRYSVSIDVSGYAKRDIAISADGDTLRLRVSRAPEAIGDAPVQGGFRRTLVLPDDADTLETDATLSGGLLKLQIPRRAKVREGARKITIN